MCSRSKKPSPPLSRRVRRASVQTCHQARHARSPHRPTALVESTRCSRSLHPKMAERNSKNAQSSHSSHRRVIEAIEGFARFKRVKSTWLIHDFIVLPKFQVPRRPGSKGKARRTFFGSGFATLLTDRFIFSLAARSCTAVCSATVRLR